MMNHFKINCLLIALMVISLSTRSQSITNYQSIELRAGKTFLPGDYAGIKYRRTTASMLDLSVGAFLEGMQKNGLRYTAYGMDLSGEYYTPVGDNTDHLFECKIGAGITGQIENEPWIYKGWPLAKRINYGFVGEVVGEWAMTEEFSTALFIQQKYLFNKSLGNTRFLLGIGLKLTIRD